MEKGGSRCLDLCFVCLRWVFRGMVLNLEVCVKNCDILLIFRDSHQ